MIVNLYVNKRVMRTYAGVKRVYDADTGGEGKRIIAIDDLCAITLTDNMLLDVLTETGERLALYEVYD